MRNDDLRFAFYFVLGGVVSVFFISREIAIGIFIFAALYSGISGMYLLFTGSKDIPAFLSLSPDKANFKKYGARSVSNTSSAPITDEPTIADRIKVIQAKNDFKCPSCGATVLPTSVKCKHCDSVLVATADLPKPETWNDIEIGQAVQLKHPKKGNLNLSVVHRVYYGELWQIKTEPDVPWTLTGSYYVGLGLDNNFFLMNWQSRFYVLDLNRPLTDMSINRNFAPRARKFAASNQTASVSFTYEGIAWRMDDIGRFRIEFVEGDGVKVSSGAVGRFIHARAVNNKNRILVVEDYQTGGGGLDTLRMGYQIKEKDFKF